MESHASRRDDGSGSATGDGDGSHREPLGETEAEPVAEAKPSANAPAETTPAVRAPEPPKAEPAKAEPAKVELAKSAPANPEPPRPGAALSKSSPPLRRRVEIRSLPRRPNR